MFTLSDSYEDTVVARRAVLQQQDMKRNLKQMLVQ